MQSVKLVVVGDGGVGKSCLLITYLTGSFPGEYIPTMSDVMSCGVKVDGNLIKLDLWDTAGQEDYDRLRPLAYPNTDIFLLCYSVESRASFSNVESKWIPEITHHTPGVPIVLVGCKQDIRASHESAALVTYEEGLACAKRMGIQYTETSALSQHGIKDCFEISVRCVVSHTGRKQKAKGFKGLFKKENPSLPDAPLMPPDVNGSLVLK